MNIHTKVSNIGDDVSKIREEVAGQIYPVSADLIHPIDKRTLTVT